MFIILLRRILRAIFVVLILSYLVFFVIRIMPGDPASLIAPMATEEAKQQIREQLGLTGSIFSQYTKFIGQVLRGDLGESYYHKKSVVSVIFSVFPHTLVLIIGSLILSLAISFPLGVISSVRPGSIIDRVSFFLSTLIASIPYFWFGMVLILILSVRYKLLPGFGYNGRQYYILPIITLTTTLIPSQLRTIRLSMEDVLVQDYILFSEARGISNKIIIWIHAFANASIPLINVLGLQSGALLGTTIMVEYLFTFPGLGLLTLIAVQRRDYQLIQGLVVVFAVICTLISTGVDIVQILIDPRIRKRMRI